MPKNRIILVIGFFLGLQPIFFHFPKAWEDLFQVVGGLGIVLLSVLISIDKRLTQKAKAERRTIRRRTKSQIEGEVSPPQNGESQIQ